MAREIQAQSNRSPGGKAAFGLLMNAIFWFIVAVAVPVEDFLRQIPEIAPFAHWAPFVFYALALWSFIRAIRTLQRLAASRMWTPRIRTAGPGAPSRPAGGKPGKPNPAAAITRPPTVQRMR